MPVYNAERYLRFAMVSILKQSFVDFEFLILDDGSTDSTSSIIQSFKDPRITLFTQANRGFVFSLNFLLKQAKGQYIARMDQDDWSHPKRLEYQINWFSNHLYGVLVGSWTKLIDQAGRNIGISRYPVFNGFIRVWLSIGNPFAHGSVMFRKNDLRYQIDYYLAEDYDLWRRIAQIGIIGNIPQPLYHWRSHPQSMSAKNTVAQKGIEARIKTEYQHWLTNQQWDGPTRNEIYEERKVRGRLRVIYGLFRSMNVLTNQRTKLLKKMFECLIQ